MKLPTLLPCTNRSPRQHKGSSSRATTFGQGTEQSSHERRFIKQCCTIISCSEAQGCKQMVHDPIHRVLHLVGRKRYKRLLFSQAAVRFSPALLNRTTALSSKNHCIAFSGDGKGSGATTLKSLDLASPPRRTGKLAGRAGMGGKA